MSSGNRSFDMTELADNLAYDEDHAAASFATPYQKLLHDVPFDAYEYTSPSIQKSVSVLREIQSKHDELKKEFFKKRAALEAKYQKLYQPLYDKRYVIVNGLVEVDGVPIRDVAAEDDAEKGIPNFWLAAMKNNEVIEDEIYEKDEGALGYLKDIRWSRMDEPTGFKLDFFFDKNPYFENSVLTKIYHMRDEQEEILEKATGTEIKWHPGKCLTSNTEKEGKLLRNLSERESFFDFFNPPPVPAQQIDIDEDDADKLQKQMEGDYDVGTTIRDKIIPHAVLWFTGEAHGAGYNLDDSDTDDDDGDDEESEDADWF